ncbi:metallophosphoesterase family protein [Paenibacillus sp. AD87]|uniref:metallophosphoesterase family protein n=1 Tax=Paenibacillus sp. AD87 TaxID=1528787 RepID=UPI0007E40F3B|nr:metallophosphoesterase [Paenibacillus sp. AD87]OAX44995.1 3',5'-cyclic adenosine monophosphate phosphodiesterase CpdA [Paenibacillus sp. AD87]
MRLIVMGDLHYSSELIEADVQMIEAREAFYTGYLSEFLAFSADYHLSIGDLTHAGEPSEFDFIMNKVKSELSQGKFLYALGNHDTHTCSKVDLQARTGQHRYLAIEEEEAVLLVLDTARENPNHWGGMIDEEQLNWLREQMNRYGQKPLLVFAHHPVYATTARSTEPMMSLDAALDIWSILNEHQGPGVFFNGHNHVQSVFQRNHWHFVQLAAVTDIPAVLLVNLQEQQLSINTILLKGTPYQELGNIFVKGMYDYEPHPDAKGDGHSAELIVSLSSQKKGMTR